MNGSKLLSDISKVQKSRGDKWIILYRKGEEIAAIYCDDRCETRIEHRARGVYMIWSGALRVIADNYEVCGY